MDGSLSGLGEATILGADDAAAETNGRSNEWWRLDPSSGAKKMGPWWFVMKMAIEIVDVPIKNGDIHGIYTGWWFGT